MLLNKTHGLSRCDRAGKLLYMHGLGDRKPSMLMNDLISLMVGDRSCLIFEQVSLEQMGEDMRCFASW